jgi:hypothetical protein
MIPFAVDVIVFHEKHNRYPGIGKDLPFGVIERTLRIVRGSYFPIQEWMLGNLKDRANFEFFPPPAEYSSSRHPSPPPSDVREELGRE